MTIIATITGGLMVSWTLSNTPQIPLQKRRIILIASSAGALFLIAFFSLHFCGFHAIHAIFLSDIFPLDSVSPERFSNTFLNPIGLWTTAIKYVLPVYGLFLIPVIIAERHHLFGPIVRCYHISRLINTNNRTDEEKHTRLLDEARKQKSTKGAFGRPYINVFRMHLLIFFFAGASELGVTSSCVFVVVYFVYFFPWRIFKGKASDGDSDPLVVAKDSKTYIPERPTTNAKSFGELSFREKYSFFIILALLILAALTAFASYTIFAIPLLLGVVLLGLDVINVNFKELAKGFGAKNWPTANARLVKDASVVVPSFLPIYIIGILVGILFVVGGILGVLNYFGLVAIG